MRAVVILTILTVPLLVPVSAIADPPQTPSQPSANAASATAPSDAAAGAPTVGERVVVHGQTPTDDTNLDQVVCRSEATTTGTRLGARRECHTEREWKRQRQEAQRITDKAQTIGDTGVVRP
jgi:hypothetical protein